MVVYLRLNGITPPASRIVRGDAGQGVVEAAGVEPASGKDQRETSTCVASSEALSPTVPRRSRRTVGQPSRFRLKASGEHSGYPAVRRPPGPPREKGSGGRAALSSQR